jgi:hypothetical protein
MTYNNLLPVFNLIGLNRNRVLAILYLPDFVYFDPLG